MLNNNYIFKGPVEDFLKIYCVTFLAFLLSFSPQLLTSSILIFITIYLLDSGHVYSTMIEVYADPNELKKPYVWIVTTGSFIINLCILLFFEDFFYNYIFYFTIFHNMRQGLGIVLLQSKPNTRDVLFTKWTYYFLTLLPFILFHFKSRVGTSPLSEIIIHPININNFFSDNWLSHIFNWGIRLYLTGIASIAVLILWKKVYTKILPILFFFSLYAFAFLISKNELQSYILLITSHAIPYYFLFEKRLKLTHSLKNVKRFAPLILILSFTVGGSLEYFQNNILEIFSNSSVLIRAMLTTPLITHFIFDGIIWKKDNKNFQLFRSSSN